MMYTAYTTNFLFPCFQYAETGGILLYFSTSINKISAFCLKKKKKKKFCQINERLFDMIILYLVN